MQMREAAQWAQRIELLGRHLYRTTEITLGFGVSNVEIRSVQRPGEPAVVLRTVEQAEAWYVQAEGNRENVEVKRVRTYRQRAYRPETAELREASRRRRLAAG